MDNNINNDNNDNDRFNFFQSETIFSLKIFLPGTKTKTEKEEKIKKNHL